MTDVENHQPQPFVVPRRTSLIYVFVLLMMCTFNNLCFAGETDVLAMTSPKLRHFFVKNPDALRAVTNVISHCRLNRTLWIYYFYSEDESQPKAYHDYPNETNVTIYVQENQEPLDECICLMFETMNSTNESRFLELINKAKAGGLSKPDFTRQVDEVEFETTRHMKDLLRRIKAANRDIKKSHYFKTIRDAPDDYDEFVKYRKGLSSSRNIIKEVEKKYDLLQKK